MPLMSINEYVNSVYTASSRPHINTIYNWIKSGKLPAEQRGGKYYIDTDKIKKSTGNEIADRILNK